MAVTINKDTKIYGSFSLNPGNNGTIFFNDAFEKYGINAIYKSFYSDNIDKTTNAVKHLNFGGFALSMPHKISVCDFLDERDEGVIEIGACNTVVIKDGRLHGYNTDWMGVLDYFDNIKLKDDLIILGNGGFSKAIQYACRQRGINYVVWGRNEIPLMNFPYARTRLFINATPADMIAKYDVLIDARPFTKEGKEIALYQAKHQFELYTNIEYLDGK